MISSSLQQLLTGLLDFGSRLCGATFVFLIGILISKIVAKGARTFLATIGVDKLGEKLNQIDVISKSNINIKISTILSKLIYYFILVTFLVIAADVLNMRSITNLLSDLVSLFPKILTAIVMLFLGILVCDMIRGLLDATLKSLGVSSSGLISSVVFYFLLVNVFIVSIGQTGIDTGFLQHNISIIIGGFILAFAVGYGLASKDIMVNFLSSFYTRTKVKIGDFISIDDEEGEIIEIDKTSITIQAKGRKVIYPLKKLLNDKVAIIDSKRLES